MYQVDPLGGKKDVAQAKAWFQYDANEAPDRLQLWVFVVVASNSRDVLLLCGV